MPQNSCAGLIHASLQGPRGDLVFLSGGGERGDYLLINPGLIPTRSLSLPREVTGARAGSAGAQLGVTTQENPSLWGAPGVGMLQEAKWALSKAAWGQSWELTLHPPGAEHPPSRGNAAREPLCSTSPTPGIVPESGQSLAKDTGGRGRI